MTRRNFSLAVAIACFTWLIACRSPAPAPAPERKLVVFAATSLRDAFTALATSFQQKNAGVTLAFNFAGTQELRTQLEHGAKADVFASADQRHMQALLAAKRVRDPVIFARNEPVVVVAKEASQLIRTFADLPKASRIVVGAPEVPIGRYTQQILERAATQLGADFRTRVEANVVSRELNVRQVLTKVSLGEAQAGFVYRSDAASAADHVSVVAIPAELNVLAEYPIAVASDAAEPALATAWITFVRSPAAQHVLQGSGFLAVSEPARQP